MKKILLIGVMLLGLLIRVNALANNITVESLVSKANEYLTQLDAGVQVEADTSNHRLVLTDGTDTYAAWDYADDYVMIDQTSVTVTKEIFEDDIYNYILMGVFNAAIFEEAGYDNYQISENYGFDNYDTYGLVVTMEEFDFPPANENEQGASGDFIRYAKMSLNPDKVAALINAYGTFEGMSVSVFKDATVDVTIEEITSDYITINLKAKNYDATSGETPVCYLYRSTSQEGTYSPIAPITMSGGGRGTANGLVSGSESAAAFNCDGDLSIIDSDVEPNTTYYYKARVALNDNFSSVESARTSPLGGTPSTDPITNTTRPVTVAPSQTQTETTTDTASNPQTGVEDYIIPIGCVTVAVVATYLGLRKKNYLKQI